MGANRFKTVQSAHEYRLAFDELGIEAEAVEIRMGRGEERLPGPFPAQIEKGLKTAAACAAISGGYVLSDNVSLSEDAGTLHIGTRAFAVGKIIGCQLRGLEAVAVFVCTAGSDISALAKNLTGAGDLIQAYVLDSIASETVERAMDRIQDKLAVSLKSGGQNISRRFSPGYCGWPVSDQHGLFSLLPENFCGVVLTEQAFMLPLKSVSGIIGIGRHVRQREYPCRVCAVADCLYRQDKKKGQVRHLSLSDRQIK